MSLKGGEETPAVEFIRKMPKKQLLMNSQERDIKSDEMQTTLDIPQQNLEH